MNRRVAKALTFLVPMAVLVAGCAQTASESRGDYHQAYDIYRRGLMSNPVNPTAAAGLRRTAPHAAAYWQRRAYAAAEAGRWDQAGAYHRRVLQIKPNELSSILSLRQIARRHPDKVTLAYAGDLPTDRAIVQAKPVPPKPNKHSEKSPVVSARPEPAKPKPQVELTAPRPAKKQQDVKPLKRKSVDRKPKQTRSKVQVATVKLAATKPSRLPTTQPARLKPSAAGVRAKPGPTSRSARPVRADRPVRVRIDPRKQKPTARKSQSASKGQFIMVVRISRDDNRYGKRASLRDGLAIRLKDTDRRPLDADVEIYLRDKRKDRRIAKFKNLGENSVISVIGRSSRRYEIVLMNIYDPTETVTVGLREAR